MAENRYTDTDLLDSLRAAAAAAGDPLSVAAYTAHQREHGGPASARIIQRLGSWNAALTAAGLQTRGGRATYSRRWTRDQLAGLVADYLASEGSTGSYSGYDAWARAATGRPSAQSVRNAFGSWSRAKEVADG